MNHRKPSRWLDALAVPAFVCALLTMGTGCGAIKAAANPKVAWAINDPAPMSVVVRRADVAEKTSKEVDRLMTDTPASDDSPWLGQVAVDKEAAAADMADLRAHDLYAGGARVVAAEVWAKELARVEPRDAKPAAPADAAVAQAEPAAPASKEAKAERVAGKAERKAGKAGKKAAKSDKAEEKEALAAPAPAASEAAPAAPAKYTSLLAAVDPELGAEWTKVMEKKKAMGEAKGEIAVLEAANDEKGISDADKKANKSKIEGLEKTVDRLEDEADKLSKAFVPKAKAAAQKAAPEVREKFGPTLVHLRQAVSDADVSNSAAAVRYPMAATTLLDSAKQMAKVYVADVIEEKTGKRPNTQSLQPGVTMEGGKVQVTLNGLGASELGQLSIGDVTAEVASRTSAWAKRALGLLGTISATKAVLGFEEDVLEALVSGFQAAGWKAPAAATIPDGPAGAQPRS
ncbi:MAG: hypothetical protein KF782_22615 [Labilithrix sp.]|nr:hypothetical protein [Labilithrix sp.]